MKRYVRAVKTKEICPCDGVMVFKNGKIEYIFNPNVPEKYLFMTLTRFEETRNPNDIPYDVWKKQNPDAELKELK